MDFLLKLDSHLVGVAITIRKVNAAIFLSKINKTGSTFEATG
jgi:hypothetical protein